MPRFEVPAVQATTPFFRGPWHGGAFFAPLDLLDLNELGGSV
jgi:hypothetical protein